MNEKAVKNGFATGRDPKTGRFLPGNKCSPGNGGHLAIVWDRQAMMDRAIPPERWERMMLAQANKAELGGDSYAFKILWEFRFGKATLPVDVTSGGKPFVPWEVALQAIEEAEERRKQPSA